MAATALPSEASPTERPRTRVLVLTGMSGAGKSSALKALEDLGYEAVDNLPLSLVPRLLEPGVLGGAVAVSVDFRTRDFGAAELARVLEDLAVREDLSVSTIFLDCDDETLRRRFTETRRRHPLAEDRPVLDGILRERALLQPVMERAETVIDTSSLSSTDLRRLLSGQFRLDAQPSLTVSILSFSYRRGLPREADLVFDVRFLSNPHYVSKLKPMTGRDAPVAQYVMSDPAYAPFMASLGAMLETLLPLYQREGTGGRHRSVYVAEQLAKRLTGKSGEVILRHRDMDADGGGAGGGR
jgi:RNase adapter protein RapZ